MAAKGYGTYHGRSRLRTALKVVIVLSVLSAAIYGLWLLLNRWNHRRPTRKIHRR